MTRRRSQCAIQPGGIGWARRLFRKASDLTHPTPARQDAPFTGQGRSERRGESYAVGYVKPLSVARTTLADFINSLLRGFGGFMMQLGLDAFEHEELEQCLIRDIVFVHDRFELI